MARRSAWRELTEVVLAASPAGVLALGCPSCGGGVSVRFDPNSPQPDGTTAGFLRVSCPTCEAGSAFDNLDETPEWVESLGQRFITAPSGGK